MNQNDVENQEQNIADQNEESKSGEGKDIVTGRLERNGKAFFPKITASIRSGKGISFLFPPGQINVGDKFRLLVSPDRVIDFSVVFKYTKLGQDGETVDGRISSDERYPLK